jgi:hypothetical protein
MKKKLKWAVIILAVIFGLLQFTNPARTNPPVANDLAATNPPPAEVTTLLHAACYDCHSYETKWPLYSKIAPSSWLVVSDVTDGRDNLNFSEWPQDPIRAAKKLERVNEELDYREMPPKKYLLMHPEARLTEAQRQTLLDWTSAEADKLRAAATNR